jgi:hypothetical protein
MIISLAKMINTIYGTIRARRGKGREEGKSL